MSYYGIYRKRLNRFGDDYQSRIQGEREHLFELFLQKTVYQVIFDYKGKEVIGSLEKWKQDETKTLQYLKVALDWVFPNGTVLEIFNNSTKTTENWMVYYKDLIDSSGYNKYIVLRMTHFINWKDRDGVKRETFAYMYGQEDNMLKDEIKSRSRMDTIYVENLKTSFFVLPTNEFMKKGDYLEVGDGNLIEGYRVVGYDIQSTPGVEYVTVDPTYIRDKSPIPEEDPQVPDDTYWFRGGVE